MNPTSIAHGPEGIRQVGHRDYIGGRWDELGTLQFEFLRRAGLEPRHVLLDVGCGCLRGGVRFIPYLAAGHYLGIDKEELLIRAGIEELGAELFLRRRPRFVVSDSFEFERFGVQPDYVLAQSVFTHLPAALIAGCFARLRAAVHAGSAFYATFFRTAVEVANPTQAHDWGYFAYTRQQMERFGAANGWTAEYVGDWGHPGDQQMVRYRPA